MIKKKVSVIFLLAFLILSSISFVMADMPEVHYNRGHQSIIEAPNSPVGQIVKNHEDDFQACMLLTDISVFYYFSEGFTAIGKEYKATHSINFAIRCLELAKTDAQVACCYGIASHLVDDTFSHNDVVPAVIRRTKLPNGIVHALTEEKIKDELVADHPELVTAVRQSLVNKAQEHKTFLLGVLQGQQGLGNINLNSMYDAFVAEVSGNSKFSVGFRAFTAVPISIHVVLILFFILGLVVMAYLIRKKDKGIFNKISMVLMLLLVGLVILFYILFFTGNVWKFFEWASLPFSSLMPTYGLESVQVTEQKAMTDFFNNGVNYLYTIRDPAGSASLASADASTAGFRLVIDIILIALVALFVWLNIRKKKK